MKFVNSPVYGPTRGKLESVMTRVLGGASSARIVNCPNFPLKSPAAHLNNHNTDIYDF